MKNKHKLAASFVACLTLVVGVGCSTIKDNISDGIVSTEETSQEQTEVYTSESGKKIPIARMMGNYLVLNNFRELVETADIIVIGEAVESLEESESFIFRASDGALTSAYSVTEFRVDNVIKGDVSSEMTINIGQSVAIIDQEALIESSSAESEEVGSVLYGVIDNYSPIKKGAKYILFLGPGSTRSDVYFPTGVAAGRVNVDGTDELVIELPEQQKIRDYAILLYQTIQQSPLLNVQNILSTVVAQSDLDFVEPQFDPDSFEPLPPHLQNLPDVDVDVPEPTVEELPPATER